MAHGLGAHFTIFPENDHVWTTRTALTRLVVPPPDGTSRRLLEIRLRMNRMLEPSPIALAFALAACGNTLAHDTTPGRELYDATGPHLA